MLLVIALLLLLHTCGADANALRSSCSEFRKAADCPSSLSCGPCQHPDSMCVECRDCPTEYVGALPQAEQDIIRCLYDVTGACNLTCRPETTPVSTLGSTPSPTSTFGQTSPHQFEVSEAPPNQATPIIICFAVLGVFIVSAGVVFFQLRQWFCRKKQQRSLLNVGICTGCERVVAGSGVAPDGLYCECT
ncbi:hypothetical protein BOX15_Mlig033626g1 [Macrostomum lignano]|uniref:TNFR-Cys domain-containing protein n=1 Tax=Macrostomum lignano TaxID=282301 RepID=A0A267EC62_9PLAT|nr:hypothetical protein BOX15_Mlig033626g1 [Macrostomum lignano]